MFRSEAYMAVLELRSIDGMYVEIGYAWISMVAEEVKGSKYFKILEYPPGFG